MRQKDISPEVVAVSGGAREHGLPTDVDEEVEKAGQGERRAV